MSKCRRVLWPLQPIGIGTPDAESAESYAWRLADAHGVPWLTLHKFINSHGPEIYKDLRGQLPRLDAPTVQAAAYMRRIADLVGRPDVELLGLSWLAGRVRAQHVFRANRAWCCTCLAEMKAGRTPYAPTTWSLAGVKHCARHIKRLREHCPACGVRISIRRVGAGDWDLCAACGCFLTTDGSGAVEQPSVIEAAVLEQMGLLVSVAAASGGQRGQPTFVETVAALHRQGHRVNPSEMARRLGVSKGTIGSLSSERTQAGIDLLLRLSTAYGIRLSDLLLKRPGDVAWLQLPVRHAPVVWPARKKPRINWACTQQALDLQVNSAAALPVVQVAEKLGVDARHLAVRRPECATTLTGRYQERLGRERMAEGEHMLTLIRTVHDWTTQRAVARCLGVSRSSRRFREAWH